MTCLGVFDRGERDKGNATGLKEGGGIEMSTTVLPLRDARSFAFFNFSIFSLFLSTVSMIPSPLNACVDCKSTSYY